MHPIIRITLETVATFVVLGLVIYGVFYYVFTKMFEASPSMKCPVEESLREDNIDVNYLTGGINGKLHEHGITRLVSTQEVSCYWSEQSLQDADYIIVVESKEIHDIFQNIRDKYFSQGETDITYLDEETSRIRIRYGEDFFINREKCKEDCDTFFLIPNFRKVYPELNRISIFYSTDRKRLTNNFFYTYLSIAYEKPIIIFSWAK